MVDMPFFVGQQVTEQITRDIVLDLFAVFDGLDVVVAPVMLDLEIALEHFADVFTNVQFAEVLQVGNAFEEQNTVDQLLGMLHLFDGLVVLPLGQFLQAPVLVHFGMQKILVDGYQLVAESLVEMFDNLDVAFHCVSPFLILSYHRSCSADPDPSKTCPLVIAQNEKKSNQDNRLDNDKKNERDWHQYRPAAANPG